MFELVSLANRIVVKYEEPKLIFHGARMLETGREKHLEWLEIAACGFFDSHRWNWPVIKSFPIKSLAEALSAAEHLNGALQEGFVVVDKDFNRVKIKSPQYVQLHHLKGNNQFSTRRAIELCQTGEIEECLLHFPEVETKVRPIQRFLEEVSRKAYEYFINHRHLTRKDYALGLKGVPYSGICFSLMTRYTEDPKSTLLPDQTYKLVLGAKVNYLEDMYSSVKDNLVELP
jgi:hypothetical protein